MLRRKIEKSSGTASAMSPGMTDTNTSATSALTTAHPGDPDRLKKDDVRDWDDAFRFGVVIEAGAVDVDVEVGSADDVDGTTWWFVRTTDDAGGPDDGPEAAFPTREAAEGAAEALAASLDELDGLTAEEYLAAADEAAAEEAAVDEDPDGEWAVYWDTTLDDAGARTRYSSRKAAETAARVADKGLRAHHPGSLLCGFSVRRLTDGEWMEVEEEQ